MEQPNLIYIDKLANGDESVKKRLIEIIKTEFPKEKKEYLLSLENLDYKKIEENVHKLKHKISILGLEKSYEIANKFEHKLRDQRLIDSKSFEGILIKISEYLKTI
ncbi:histidine kinase [Formosa sp. Hel1_33_131]|uniref:histidine kinase n=1 Tax=Formosa sp. Hel1_33_131 TaxID=1336794 RepID=UPI00084E352E|nr:histidine kinase [Formosa sp. Hel1_33_131]AOR27921.1 histidine kinase [Formosa sp. Hel1_33_131]